MGEKAMSQAQVGIGTIQTRYLGAGLAFLLILLTGYWLSRSGKPYSTIVFNLHKLIAVAAVILLGITVYRMNRAGELTTIGWLASIVTGVFFLGTMATGGALSVEAGTQVTMPANVSAIVHKLHQVTPYGTVLSSAATLFFLRG